MSEEQNLRNDVIDETTENVHQVFVNINKKLKDGNRRFITVDETDIVLSRIRNFTMEARVIDWVSKFYGDVPSPQMSKDPATKAYA